MYTQNTLSQNYKESNDEPPILSELESVPEIQQNAKKTNKAQSMVENRITADQILNGGQAINEDESSRKIVRASVMTSKKDSLNSLGTGGSAQRKDSRNSVGS